VIFNVNFKTLSSVNKECICWCMNFIYTWEMLSLNKFQSATESRDLSDIKD